MKDFEGYNWLSLRAPMILCADFLHDDSASVWPRDDDTEGHFKKQLFGPLYPSKLSLQRVKPLKGLGHRDEPFRRERRLWDWLLFQLVFSGQLTNCSLSHSVLVSRERLEGCRLVQTKLGIYDNHEPEVTQYPEVHSFWHSVTRCSGDKKNIVDIGVRLEGIQQKLLGMRTSIYSVIVLTLYNNNYYFCIIAWVGLGLGVGVDINKTQSNSVEN